MATLLIIFVLFMGMMSSLLLSHFADCYLLALNKDYYQELNYFFSGKDKAIDF